MGNTIRMPSTGRGSGHRNAEPSWDHFPHGTEGLFNWYRDSLRSTNAFTRSVQQDASRTGPKSEVVTFRSPGEQARDGLDLVINFVILGSQLFLEDREYDWNLDQTLRSAYNFAADFLLLHKRGGIETMLMTFYAAFLEECASRGFDAASSCWAVRGSAGRPEDGAAATVATGGCLDVVRLRDEILFADLAHLHRAVAATRSTRALADFLAAKLGGAGSRARRVRDVRGRAGGPRAAIHSFEMNGAVPEALMKIQCFRGDGPAIVKMEVYGDTTLNWVFEYCISRAQGSFRRGLHAVTKRRLCLWNVEKSHIFFLETSGKKSLSDLGIEDGDTFQVLCSMLEVEKFSKTAGRDNESVSLPKGHRSIQWPLLTSFACCSSSP